MWQVRPRRTGDAQLRNHGPTRPESSPPIEQRRLTSGDDWETEASVTAVVAERESALSLLGWNRLSNRSAGQKPGGPATLNDKIAVPLARNRVPRSNSAGLRPVTTRGERDCAPVAPSAFH